ncbi:MAG TPA: hypothetical protein VGN25_00760 [Solirubrobacteraceae bacterium]|jgi:hypothetical protein|nr:hypothetical protein [Solirubrobacteraceae bacterium]
MILGGNWGASAEECSTQLACDRLLPTASLRMHRAISVQAPSSLVFLWLCQLKLAPYSYDLLDNFGRKSPQQLANGLDQLEAGQRFMTIFSLVSFCRDAHITLRSRRVAVTYAVSAQGSATRLLVRVIFDPPGARVGATLLGNALALGDLVMMRKQLLTLKALAERDAVGLRAAEP